MGFLGDEGYAHIHRLWLLLFKIGVKMSIALLGTTQNHGMKMDDKGHRRCNSVPHKTFLT